jgi:hypothetical protein
MQLPELRQLSIVARVARRPLLRSTIRVLDFPSLQAKETAVYSIEGKARVIRSASAGA